MKVVNPTSPSLTILGEAYNRVPKMDYRLWVQLFTVDFRNTFFFESTGVLALNSYV